MFTGALGTSCPLHDDKSPGHAVIGSGVSPESGIRVWLCGQIGKPAAAVGLHGKTQQQWKKIALAGSLVEGAQLGRWHHLLPAQQDVAWPHHTAPEDVPGRTHRGPPCVCVQSCSWGHHQG